MINYKNLIFEMNKELKLNLENKSNFKMKKDFLEETLKIFFFLCCICYPQIKININQIGKKVKFNNRIHDNMDGFIKSKQFSIIILIMFFKGKEATNESTIIKSQVLGKDYILPRIKFFIIYFFY